MCFRDWLANWHHNPFKPILWFWQLYTKSLTKVFQRNHKKKGEDRATFKLSTDNSLHFLHFVYFCHYEASKLDGGVVKKKMQCKKLALSKPECSIPCKTNLRNEWNTIFRLKSFFFIFSIFPNSRELHLNHSQFFWHIGRLSKAGAGCNRDWEINFIIYNLKLASKIDTIGYTLLLSCII